jgi:hypothetical protein
MASIVGIQKIRFPIDAANAIVTSAVIANTEPSMWLAVLNQTLITTTLIGRKIRRYAMFGTGFSVFCETIRGVTTRTVLVAYC